MRVLEPNLRRKFLIKPSDDSVSQYYARKPIVYTGGDRKIKFFRFQRQKFQTHNPNLQAPTKISSCFQSMPIMNRLSISNERTYRLKFYKILLVIRFFPDNLVKDSSFVLQTFLRSKHGTPVRR